MAVGILVMVGGVAVAASIRTVNVETYSKNRTRAQDLARNQIERLRVIRDSDYKDNNPQTTWNSGVDACLTTGRESAIGFINDEGGWVGCGQGGTRKWPDSPLYQMKVLVEKVPDNFNGPTKKEDGYSGGLDENKNLRRVTVTVTWTEPFLSREQDVIIKTYISNDKIGS